MPKRNMLNDTLWPCMRNLRKIYIVGYANYKQIDLSPVYWLLEPKVLHLSIDKNECC